MKLCIWFILAAIFISGSSSSPIEHQQQRRDIEQQEQRRDIEQQQQRRDIEEQQQDFEQQQQQHPSPLLEALNSQHDFGRNFDKRLEDQQANIQRNDNPFDKRLEGQFDSNQPDVRRHDNQFEQQHEFDRRLASEPPVHTYGNNSPVKESQPVERSPPEFRDLIYKDYKSHKRYRHRNDYYDDNNDHYEHYEQDLEGEDADNNLPGGGGPGTSMPMSGRPGSMGPMSSVTLPGSSSFSLSPTSSLASLVSPGSPLASLLSPSSSLFTSSSTPTGGALSTVDIDSLSSTNGPLGHVMPKMVVCKSCEAGIKVDKAQIIVNGNQSGPGIPGFGVAVPGLDGTGLVGFGGAEVGFGGTGVGFGFSGAPVVGLNVAGATTTGTGAARFGVAGIPVFGVGLGGNGSSTAEMGANRVGGAGMGVTGLGSVGPGAIGTGSGSTGGPFLVGTSGIARRQFLPTASFFSGLRTISPGVSVTPIGFGGFTSATQGGISFSGAASGSGNSRFARIMRCIAALSAQQSSNATTSTIGSAFVVNPLNESQFLETCQTIVSGAPGPILSDPDAVRSGSTSFFVTRPSGFSQPRVAGIGVAAPRISQTSVVSLLPVNGSSFRFDGGNIVSRQPVAFSSPIVSQTRIHPSVLKAAYLQRLQSYYAGLGEGLGNRRIPISQLRGSLRFSVGRPVLSRPISGAAVYYSRARANALRNQRLNYGWNNIRGKYPYRSLYRLYRSG